MTDAGSDLPRPERAGATHRLVVRGGSGDRVAAENRLAAAAMAAGDRAVLTVDDGLADYRPGAVARLERELDRRDDAVGGSADRGYVAGLPDDADAVREVLTVPDAEREAVGPHGEAAWRAWEVRDLLVLAGDEWICHLIPHETRAWVNADAAPGLPDRVEAALEGSAAHLVPAGPLLTWGEDPGDAEGDPDERSGSPATAPDPDGLWADRVRLDGRSVDLGRVERVGIDVRRGEAVFDVGAGTAGSGGLGRRLVGRVGRAALDATGIRDDATGSHRVRFSDAGALGDLEDALVELRDRLDYGFELVRIGDAPGE